MTEPRVAITDGDTHITVTEFEERQRALAGLLREGDIATGDRIAILASNRHEYLEVTMGALRSGVIPVPVNPLLKEDEVRYIVEDSGVRWLFTDSPVANPEGLERTIRFGADYDALMTDASPATIARYVLTRPMHYTSGTTGRPKGVYVAPMNEEEAARRSHSFRQLWGLNDKDVHLVCSPFGHSAPHRFAMRTLESGGRVIVGGKFEPLDVLSNVSRHRVTSTFMVPTHLERILRLEPSELRRHDLSSMRLLAHAGAPISEETKLKAMRVFPARSMWEFYGSTEGPATRISPEEWLSKKGSVGRASGTARIRILNEELEESPVGEVGEVWIEDADAERFSYWGDKAKTEAAWRGDSYSVGDLGWVDTDGYLYLTGRRHDTIITGGVNVYPQEVELSLLEHPQIEDAVVFGVVNQEWGQEVRAQVVPVAEHDLDEETVRAWLSRRIATYKCPRRIEFVRSLQRTATGKLIRTGLDDLYN